MSDCLYDEDDILVDIPEYLDITATMQGGCLLLFGSASVAEYRKIIESAR